MQVRRVHRMRPQFAEPSFAPRNRAARIGDAVIETLKCMWLPALVFLVPLLYYWPSLQVGFLSDDFYYHSFFGCTAREFVERLYLNYKGLVSFAFFRPAVYASFRLDYLLWGADAVGFHFTNLLLHSVNAVLIFALAGRIGLGRAGAASAALLFGLYPASPEAVTWISGRFDLAATMFLLIALLFWCEARLRNDAMWIIPSMVAFLLALMSKENAFAGILLLPLVDWLLHLRTSREWGHGIGWQWKWYLAFIALILCMVAFRIIVYHDFGGYYDQQNRAMWLSTPLLPALGNLFGADLRMLISPVSRVMWPEWSSAWHAAIAGAAVVTAIGLLEALAWAVVRARSIDWLHLALIITGVAWAVAMLLPVATIAGVEGSLDRSRFLYLSVAGLALWFGVAADMGWRRGIIWRRSTIVLLIGVLLVSGAILRKHNSAWLVAGDIARGISAAMVARTADLPDGSTVFSVNLPLLWKGAHCAPLGVGGYLEFERSIRGIEDQILRMPPEEVAGWWESVRANWNRPGIGFVWDGASRTLSVLPPFEPSAAPDENALRFLGQETTESHDEVGREVEVLPERP